MAGYMIVVARGPQIFLGFPVTESIALLRVFTMMI
jgi:hypothetical protein